MNYGGLGFILADVISTFLGMHPLSSRRAAKPIGSPISNSSINTGITDQRLNIKGPVLFPTFVLPKSRNL